MEVLNKYKFTFNDLYEGDEDSNDFNEHKEEDKFKDYKAFKEANKELFDNTEYYIVDTSYTKRLFGWDHHKGKHEDYESIIAVEARHDGGYYGKDDDSDNDSEGSNDSDDEPFCYIGNEEGQYLIDNFSEEIVLENKTKHLYGWIGFKANKKLDIIGCVDILNDMSYCGGLYLSYDLKITWFKTPNGKIAAFIDLDTESG